MPNLFCNVAVSLILTAASSASFAQALVVKPPTASILQQPAGSEAYRTYKGPSVDATLLDVWGVRPGMPLSAALKTIKANAASKGIRLTEQQVGPEYTRPDSGSPAATIHVKWAHGELAVRGRLTHPVKATAKDDYLRDRVVTKIELTVSELSDTEARAFLSAAVAKYGEPSLASRSYLKWCATPTPHPQGTGYCAGRTAALHAYTASSLPQKGTVVLENRQLEADIQKKYEGLEVGTLKSGL